MAKEFDIMVQRTQLTALLFQRNVCVPTSTIFNLVLVTQTDTDSYHNVRESMYILSLSPRPKSIPKSRSFEGGVANIPIYSPFPMLNFLLEILVDL